MKKNNTLSALLLASSVFAANTHATNNDVAAVHENANMIRSPYVIHS